MSADTPTIGRRTTTRLGFIVGVLVFLSGAVYVWGYFSQSMPIDRDLYADSVISNTRDRLFDHEWQCSIYGPMASIESWWTGMHVELGTSPFMRLGIKAQRF